MKAWVCLLTKKLAAAMPASAHTCVLPCAGATLADPFVISGNSLGAKDWDGRSNQWYTGSGDSGHWEDINCGAHFKCDLNNYLSTAGTKYRNVQVCRSSITLLLCSSDLHAHEMGTQHSL